MIFIDQMNRTIRLESTPKRIVSLVPSQTELLADLGLENQVVGITKFCIYPETWFKSKTRIGGTKKIDIEKVKSLNPDLIIGNKEENTKEDIAELEKISPVWMSDIFTLKDALEMIVEIGNLTNTPIKASEMAEQINHLFSSIVFQKSRQTVAYLIWKNPYMVAAKNTFIDDLLIQIGFDNFFKSENRYPEWLPSISNQPDLVFLSSEPFPFSENDRNELQYLLPNSNVILVDGEFFSWYGSRLLHAIPYFKNLISLIQKK